MEVAAEELDTESGFSFVHQGSMSHDAIIGETAAEDEGGEEATSAFSFLQVGDASSSAAPDLTPAPPSADHSGAEAAAGGGEEEKAEAASGFGFMQHNHSDPLQVDDGHSSFSFMGLDTESVSW